jgi:hypothetical protein
MGAIAFTMLATPDFGEVPLHVPQDNEIKESVIVQTHQAAPVDHPLPATPAVFVTSVKVPSPLLC